MAGVTQDDLDRLERRLSEASDQRIADLKAWLQVAIAPAIQQSRGWDIVAKALQPSSLVLLVVLAAVLIGGPPVAVAVVQGYLPKVPGGTVQINSNNAPEIEPIATPPLGE